MEKNPENYHLGSNWEISESLYEINFGWDDEDPLSIFPPFLTENAGLLGAEISTASLLIIENTSNMEGLSSGFS